MDDQLLSIAQQFSGLPIDSLIGGPLIATTKANANMAFTQTQFLLDNCFNKTTEGENTNYTPIMIQMVLTNNVITPADPNKPDSTTTVTPFNTVFNLPILTIMPLNSLAVESVDVNFEMEVQSSSAQDSQQDSSSETKGEGGFEAKVGWGPFSVTIHGSASYDSKESSTTSSHYKKSNSAKYSIAVHAGQLPLPQGVLTIIDAYSKNISPIQLPAVAPAPAPAT
jgi:hypothetical protein